MATRVLRPAATRRAAHEGLMLRIGYGVLALLGAAGLFAGLWHYPLHGHPLVPVLLVYAGLYCWRKQTCLLALPMLLPMLDLAPWTGWFFVEECDLLLCLTMLIGYTRLACAAQAEADLDPPRLPQGVKVAAIAFSLASLISLWRGLLPLAPLDANAYTTYLSPYNSLRMAKPWCWTLLLLPVLRHSAGPQLDGVRRYFLPGVLGGLTLVSLACTWERWIFPGVLNFSTDYRTTALFSGMHMGGAALDGYLALCAPLLAAYLLPPAAVRQAATQTAASALVPSSPPEAAIVPAAQLGRKAGPLFLLALASYAGMSTFSRGLFAAYACSAAMLLAYSLYLQRRSAVTTGGSPWRMMAVSIYLTVFVVDLLYLFLAGGYRALAAALILLVAGTLLSGIALPWRQLPACAVIGMLTGYAIAALPAGPAWLTIGWLKRPYLPFLLAALFFSVIVLNARRRDGAGATFTASIILIAFVSLAGDSVRIAVGWGGDAAWWPALGAIALAMIPAGMGALPPRHRTDLAPSSLPLLAGAAILCAIAIPVLASYYAGTRFASAGQDAALRLRHWEQVRQMQSGDLASSLFGMGSGTFPSVYFWKNPEGETPATLRYRDAGGNRYLELGTPGYARGYGELMRVLQHVDVQPHTMYLLGLDMRRSGSSAVLQVRVCQRQLLYPQHCVHAPLRQPPADGQWHRLEVTLDAGVLGQGTWPHRAPVQLELAVAGGPATVDIDNIALHGPPGTADLLRNGNFSDGNDYWFFSSDRHHLPWHIKNLALHVWFEQGWFGLLAFTALLGSAVLPSLRRARTGDLGAAAMISGVAGFLVVGVFDSLLDVPRLSLLFFLLLLLGVLEAAPQPHRRVPQRK